LLIFVAFAFSFAPSVPSMMVSARGIFVSACEDLALTLEHRIVRRWLDATI